MKYVDGYTDLANAIIKQAVKDYEKALKRLARNPNNRKAKKDIEEIESFFTSEWYRILTDLDSRYLLRMVKERVEKLIREEQ